MKPHAPHAATSADSSPRTSVAHVCAGWIGRMLLAVASIGTLAAAQCFTTTNVQPQVGNIPAYSVRCVYDTAGARVLAINQAPADGLGVLVYAYDGASWTTLPRLGVLPPGDRRYAGVWTYDISRGEALLFGGLIGSITGTPTNTLYAFRNGAWQPKSWTGVNPPADGAFTGTYDSRRNRTIYLCPSPSAAMYRTWEWTGTVWEQGPEFGPVVPEAFTFDASRNVAFLLASATGDPNPVDDVWEYTPPAPGAPASQGQWNRVPLAPIGLSEAYVSTTLAYDPFRGRIIRCLGRFSGSTYGYLPSISVWDPINRVWDYDSFLDLSLPYAAARAGAGVAYDTNRDLLVITGGARQEVPSGSSGGFIPFFDTWEQRVHSPGLASSSFGPVARCVGDAFLLAVSPVGDPGTIQWTRNGMAVGSGPLLNIPAVSTTDSGVYLATITNSCGTYVSPASTLRVDVPITFDAPTFWPGCSTCPGSNVVIIPGVPSAASQAGAPLQMRLQKYVADAWTDVQVVAPGAPFQLSNVQSSDSGDYRVFVSGSACPGVVESIRRIDVGVSFVTQPAAQNISPCSNATFSVQVRGTCVQAFQWFKNGQPLGEDSRFSGVSTPSLSISGCRFEDEGSYSCRVTDACETRFSNAATLTLTTPVWSERPMNAQPQIVSALEYWTSAFDEHRGVMVLYGGTTQTGQDSNALWEYDGFTWTVRQPGYPFVTTGTGQFLFDGFFPPNPDACAMVYNPDDRKVYLIAPFSATHPLAICTWDGTTWQRPYYGPVNGDTTRTHAVYDRVNRRIVMVRSVGGSNNSELLIYDPATNTMTGPIPMQPQVQIGVNNSALWYDELRNAVIWYNNISIFQSPTMWKLESNAQWSQLPSNPPRLPLNTPIQYDPIRFQAVGMGGVFDGATYSTATIAWPHLANQPWLPTLPPANDWTQVLPDGPPRNPLGAGVSPPNFWGPRQWGATVFDRKRRAMVAAGVTYLSGLPQESWRTYERRYLDRVSIDKPITVEQLTPTSVRLEAVAAGAGILGYSWRRNGSPVVDGPGPRGETYNGATSRSLTVTNLPPSFTAYFTCDVTNACGTIMTAPATIGCPADFNGNGLAPSDIFDFLNAWFASDPAADFNGGGIGVSDIFDFLNAWFNGC